MNEPCRGRRGAYVNTGAPAKPAFGFVGRGGARERSWECPEGRFPLSGLCPDGKQEKAPALICAEAPTSARSAGSFQRRRLALFWTAKNAISAILMQKGQKTGNLRLLPDAISKNGGFSA